MEPSKNDPPVSIPARTKSESKTGSVYVGNDRYTIIGKAALRVSNHIATGRIISAGEMTQYLVDHYLDLAWRSFAVELNGQPVNSDVDKQ